MGSRNVKYRLLIAVFLMGIISSVNAQHSLLQLLSKNNALSENTQDNNVIMNSRKDSFAKAIRDIDEVLKKEAEPCTLFDPEKPTLAVEGRRVSEIKCFEHIWNVKLKEETKKRVDQCRAIYGNEFTGITGGRSSKPGEFPHMGALGWEGAEQGKYVFKCGSFLISDRFALTAAHCYENINHPKIVRFGVVNITERAINPEPPVDIEILNFIKHPSYDSKYKAYDIAIIKLAKRVTFNEYIQPACIINQDIKEANITGWGSINKSDYNKMNDDLQVAKVDVLKFIECKRRWKQKQSEQFPKFLRSQMCGVEMNGEADICGGDSGGPLQTELNVNTNRSIHNVVGIASFSYMCGSHNFPSIYTKVNSLIDWIEEVVWSGDD